MKKMMLALLLTVVSAVSALAAENYFSKYEQEEGVEVININMAMLKMAGNMNFGGNMDTADIAGKLTGLQILNVENNDAQVGKFAQIVKDLFSTAKGYENMLHTADAGETVDILFHEVAKSDNEMVIISREKDELSVIVLSGTFTSADIASMAGK